METIKKKNSTKDVNSIQPKNRVKSERRRRGRQGPTQNISSGNNESQDKELEMRMSGAQSGATAELWPVMLQ